MDIQTKLFETALGIEEPLYIKHIDFVESVGELHIHIDFRRGSKFFCPSCSNKPLASRKELIVASRK